MYSPSYRKSGRERLRNLTCGSFGNTPKLSRTEEDSARSVLRGSQVGFGRWALERVEMSADRLDRTRAVTARLTKRDPTKGKSVRERLRRISQRG